MGMFGLFGCSWTLRSKIMELDVESPRNGDCDGTCGVDKTGEPTEWRERVGVFGGCCIFNKGADDGGDGVGVFMREAVDADGDVRESFIGGALVSCRSCGSLPLTIFGLLSRDGDNGASWSFFFFPRPKNARMLLPGEVGCAATSGAPLGGISVATRAAVDIAFDPYL